MLPRLRATLDFIPSPIEDKPGLLIRDPFQFSDATLIVPPVLIECLSFFDGERSALDLRAHLVRITGDLQAGDIETNMYNALSNAGFLEDETFERLRAVAEMAFAEAPVREPVHAGTGYPDNPDELRETLDEYMAAAPEATIQAAPHVAGRIILTGETPERVVLTGERPEPLAVSSAISLTEPKRVLAIVAPHVSPFGGVESYRAAYSALTPADADRTIVILGTSHYGQSNRLGLTRKSFVTPLGEAVTDTKLAGELERKLGPAALMEDYCHAIEHSIEFQVVFLQHLLGPRIRILPILCGSYTGGLSHGAVPEENDQVQRILGTLGDIAAREGESLLWVLGVDMAHMGRRYGDPFTAIAGQDSMDEVTSRDRARIACMEAGDAEGFWELIRENQDDLKWCGSAPIYTFLRSVPQVYGQMLRYQQWNIDEASVVSFAGVKFHSR